jgi:uncharacterized protein (TIGR01777 family)
MHILVTGSSGLIGTALVRRLGSQGHRVTRLVRRAPRPGEARWDPEAGTIDAAVVDGVDAIVNLAGAGIGDHRWTDEYKRTLVDSRVRGTTLLARTIAEASKRPSVLLSGSAVGIYGARGDEEIDETSALGDDFLADLCRQWEAATDPAAQAGVRVAHLRTGLVLSGQGGALKKQLKLFKLGLGGRIGSGKQWQSWISLEDHVSAMVHLLSHSVSGPVNVTAPHPVRQAQFADALGHELHRPTILPIPGFGPKLLLGRELVEHLLLTGQRVLPRALAKSGFQFAHPTLEVALAAVLR